MKRKDEVGPKIKYDEMINMYYMQGNVKPCGWNESTCKGEIMKIHHACMKIGLRADGSEQSLIKKDSTERELESMYLVIFFYLDIASLASLMCCNRLDCLGYKYVPPSIVERFITRSINKSYFFFAIYFFVGDFAIFFFLRVLSS